MPNTKAMNKCEACGHDGEDHLPILHNGATTVQCCAWSNVIDDQCFCSLYRPARESEPSASDDPELAICRVLDDYRCRHTVEEDGYGLGLVDVLTPEGEDSITLGRNEVLALAEYLFDRGLVISQTPDAIPAETRRQIVAEALNKMVSQARHDPAFEQPAISSLCFFRDAVLKEYESK